MTNAALATAIPLLGRTADLASDLELPDVGLVELPDDALVELPADALVELPADALVELPDEDEALELDAADKPALDLGSALLGSDAWRGAFAVEQPATAPETWPPAPPKNSQLCDNLAGLRFDALPPANDRTKDVPNTPPPPPVRLAPPPMPAEGPPRPLPEIVHARKTPAQGFRPPEVGAPTVVGVDDGPRPAPAPRTPTPRPRMGPRQIREVSEGGAQVAAPAREVRTPSSQQRKAEAFYEAALECMAAHDYAAAYRHLTLALSFAPGDPRYATARQKVQRIVSL